MAKAVTGAAWSFRQSRQWHSPTRRGSPEAWSSICPHPQLARRTGSGRGPAISMRSLSLPAARATAVRKSPCPGIRTGGVPRAVALAGGRLGAPRRAGQPCGRHPPRRGALPAGRARDARPGGLAHPHRGRPPRLHQAAAALLGDGARLRALRRDALGGAAAGGARRAGAGLGDGTSRAPGVRTRGGAGGDPGPRNLPRAAPLRPGRPDGRSARAGHRRGSLGLLARRRGWLDAAPAGHGRGRRGGDAPQGAGGAAPDGRFRARCGSPGAGS